MADRCQQQSEIFLSNVEDELQLKVLQMALVLSGLKRTTQVRKGMLLKSDNIKNQSNTDVQLVK